MSIAISSRANYALALIACPAKCRFTIASMAANTKYQSHLEASSVLYGTI